ncbi:MAG: TIGR04255 family protein [Candidatus Omnitrophica bacterium]|nr:TIGR04255 family protein [Candidatus Omnitrophota bacterium]
MPDPFAETCYRRNFLKEVIARVDFVSPLPGVEAALPPRLIEVAVGTFPIAEPREAVQRAVEIGPQGVQSSEERFKEWLFHGKERTKTLTIGRQVVLVQHRTYHTYEIVKAEFLGVLDRVAELFPGAQPSRVGLRYVNTIELAEANPTDWSAYLAPQLLSLFQFPLEADRPALSRVFHNLELAFDAFHLRYRLGMHNPDYPARIRQKVFVLDLDAYTHSAVDIREVSHLLDDFHTTIQRYFEQSITDNLRGIMNAA